MAPLQEEAEVFNYVKGRLRCFSGKHERSEHKIRKVGDVYASRCRYCGVPMRRVQKRRWVVDRGVGRL